MQHLTILPARTRADAVRDIQAALKGDFHARRISAMIAALKAEIGNPHLVNVLDGVWKIWDADIGSFEAAKALSEATEDIILDNIPTEY